MPETLPGTPQTLAAVTLLALAGGLLDAVVYRIHGQVFANAMTGNAALLGIALLSNEHGQAPRHVIPLAAFAVGVLLGKWLLRWHGRSSYRYALLIQMAVLGVAGAVPQSFPSNPIVAMVALTGALQVTTIRRMGDVPFNITFMTGNLRAVFEGISDGLWSSTASLKARRGMKQFAVVGLICSGFFVGAVLGAASSPRFGNRSFWIADGLLLAAGMFLHSVPHARSSAFKISVLEK